MRSMLTLGVAFLLAMSGAVATGFPASALTPDDELPATPPAHPPRARSSMRSAMHR